MFENFIITALRNFRKNRIYTMINVLGLGLGMTCCLVMYTILRHEFGFDDFHKNKENIYRIVEHYSGDNGMHYSGRLPNPLGYSLSENKRKIKDVIPMHGPLTATVKIRQSHKVDVYKDRGILFTSSSFLRNLDFPIAAGSGPELLDEYAKVFITQQMAEKYFGTLNPLGQFITYGEDLELEVVGILENTPTTTNVPFEILVSYPTLRRLYPDYISTWGATWVGSAYVVANPTDDIQELEEEINALVHSHLTEEEQLKNAYFLQPLADVHTDARYMDSVNYVPPTEAIYGTLFLVICILLASILNFINLATSQAVRRSREIGIRKTLGSSKRQIILQFYGETFLLVTAGALLALTFAQFIINLMNDAISPMPFHLSYDLVVIPWTGLLVVLVSLLAGLYPAFILSNYNPIQALRNQISLSKGSGKLTLRRVLVTIQFGVANLLIVATIIVSSQMRMIQNSDLGFDPSDILQVHFPDNALDKRDVIMAEFDKQNFVAGTSWNFGPPQAVNTNWNTTYHLVGMPEEDHLHTRLKFIDDRYLDTYNISLLAGTNIENSRPSDSTTQVIVTREFVKRLGYTNPAEALGLKVAYQGSNRGTIQGIVEDFHADKLTSEIKPVLMTYQPYQMNFLTIKLQEGAMTEQAVADIERLYRTFAPEALFEMSVLTEQIQDSYLLENMIHHSFRVFAMLSLFIGLLGLYGLVTYMIERNKKTMSIRKVFGASWQSIIQLISREYVVLILISFALVAPLSYLICSQWLGGFAYQIDISIWHYVAGLGLIMAIAISTVSLKSYRAATANPVDALRQE